VNRLYQPYERTQTERHNPEDMKTRRNSPNRLSRFLKEALRVIDDLEQFVCRLLEFLDRVTIRLLLYGLLIYHVYVVVHALPGR